MGVLKVSRLPRPLRAWSSEGFCDRQTRERQRQDSSRRILLGVSDTQNSISLSWTIESDSNVLENYKNIYIKTLA